MKVLVDQLKEASAEVRGQAAESLGKLGAEARPAVPALIDRIADDVWNPGYGTRDSSTGNSSKDAALVALRVISHRSRLRGSPDQGMQIWERASTGLGR